MTSFPQNIFQRFIFLFAVNFMVMTHSGCAHQIPTEPPAPSEKSVFTVDGKVALASLISLSDGHLQKLVDELSLVAMSREARSGIWSKMRGSLADLAQHNVAAVLWFALPDGTYWSVDEGQVSGNLADRPYWSKVMQGQTVMGDLVVSKSTGRNVAIVAVPVRRADKSVAAVLGASVYLDKLSQQLKQEMALEDKFIFYAIDSTVKGALNSNTRLIFTHPKEFGPEMSKVIDEMVSRQEGVASYHFEGGQRTVLYQKSPAIDWWYAIGVIKKD